MCVKQKFIELYNEAGLKLGVIGSLSNTYQGLLNVCAKKGGRIIFGFAKSDTLTTDANDFENIVEVGGGAVPHLTVNGICNAEKFNNGITDEVTIGNVVLTIKGGVITKVEEKK